VCPECGLDLDGSERFDPVLMRLGWYTEHAAGVSDAIKRTPSTLTRLALPWRFWASLPMSAQIRIRPLCVWGVILILVCHALSSLVVVYLNLRGRTWAGNSGISGMYRANGPEGLFKLIFDGIAAPYFEYWLYDGRIYADSPFSGFWDLYRGGGVSAGELTPYGFAMVVSMLMWVIVICVVPITRRRAKVRAAHIARAIVIALVAHGISFELFRALYFMGERMYTLRWVQTLSVLGVAGSMLWQWIYWPCVLAIGWRIRPSFLLITLGTIASVLGVVVLTSLLLAIG